MKNAKPAQTIAEFLKHSYARTADPLNLGSRIVSHCQQSQENDGGSTALLEFATPEGLVELWATDADVRDLRVSA